MATVKPFPALRPSNAEAVASVPYDVVTREEVKALVKDKPQSYLRVIRSEVDLPDEVSAYDDSVYTKAKEQSLYILIASTKLRHAKRSNCF